MACADCRLFVLWSLFSSKSPQNCHRSFAPKFHSPQFPAPETASPPSPVSEVPVHGASPRTDRFPSSPASARCSLCHRETFYRFLHCRPSLDPSDRSRSRPLPCHPRVHHQEMDDRNQTRLSAAERLTGLTGPSRL